MKKITIHEIAKALDIDASTVSRALNDSTRVAEKTKEKILFKAKELGYQPNLLASNLRQNKSNTLGVVVPRLSRFFFSSTIAGIEEAAFAEGFNVIISQSLELVKREKKIINNFVSNRVDGVLISISWETVEGNHLEHLEGMGIPLVFFDRHIPAMANSNRVIIDDFKGGYEATKHLIKKGCKKIVHFAGPKTLDIYVKRQEGYQQALREHDLFFDHTFIKASKLMREDGEESIVALLGKHPDIDGVFSANDEAAFGAVKYLKSKGKRVPEDVAVIGFSNDILGEFLEPTLSTIDQFGYEMGKKACKLLIRNINEKDGNTAFESVVIVPKLIERESSRK